MNAIVGRRFNIRKQLIYSITLVHAVLMSIFVADMSYRQREYLINGSNKHASELAETIANNSVSWLLANDLVGLQEIISSQKRKSNLKIAMVISNENRILAHTDQSKVGKYILENEDSWQGSTANIQFNNRVIGKVFISLSLDELNLAFINFVKYGILYILSAIAIGAIVAWLMAKYLTKGIESLSLISAKIKEGQRGLRVQIFRQDEVGQLAEDFNSMLEALETKEKNLLTIQESLSVAKEIAEKAGQTKADFLANMSHELRTPLNAVVGFCEVLGDTQLNIEQRDFLIRIKNSGHVLQYLIDDILEFSRLESVKIHLEKVPFNLRAEIRKLIEMHELSIKSKNLQFHLDFDDTIPNSTIGDAFRLIQILNNLMSNAIKFTPSGGITLSIKKVFQNEKNIQLEFRIKDTGIGIHKEQISLLFNPFTQADTSITKKYGGTGLGLAISRRLAQLMDGDIYLESELGKGSTFIFKLSMEYSSETLADRGEACQILDFEPAVGVLKGEHFVNDQLISDQQMSDQIINDRLIKNKTILIVDDNLMNLEVAGLTLNKFGFKTLFAENGTEAVEIVEKMGNKVDLVLMDLQMPVLDGYMATEKIRQLPNGLKVPIVAFSARAFDSDLERCFACGMNDHIAKPIDRKELLAKLKKHLAIGV